MARLYLTVHGNTKPVTKRIPATEALRWAEMTERKFVQDGYRTTEPICGHIKMACPEHDGPCVEIVTRRY